MGIQRLVGSDRHGIIARYLRSVILRGKPAVEAVTFSGGNGQIAVSAGIGHRLACCRTAAAVGIKTHHIGVCRPCRLDGHILRGHGGGDRLVPAVKTIARLGRILGRGDRRAIILRDGRDHAAAVGVEGDGVLADGPVGLQRQALRWHGGGLKLLLAVVPPRKGIAGSDGSGKGDCISGLRSDGLDRTAAVGVKGQGHRDLSLPFTLHGLVNGHRVAGINAVGLHGIAFQCPAITARGVVLASCGHLCQRVTHHQPRRQRIADQIVRITVGGAAGEALVQLGIRPCGDHTAAGGLRNAAEGSGNVQRAVDDQIATLAETVGRQHIGGRIALAALIRLLPAIRHLQTTSHIQLGIACHRHHGAGHDAVEIRHGIAAVGQHQIIGIGNVQVHARGAIAAQIELAAGRTAGNGQGGLTKILQIDVANRRLYRFIGVIGGRQGGTHRQVDQTAVGADQVDFLRGNAAPEVKAGHADDGRAALHHHGVLHIDGGVLAKGEALSVIQRFRIGTSGIVGDQIGDLCGSAVDHTGGAAAGDLAVYRQGAACGHLHRAIADDLCVIAGSLALGILVGGMLHAAHDEGTVHRQGLACGNGQLAEGRPSGNGGTGACGCSLLIASFIAGAEGYHQRHAGRDRKILRNRRILQQDHRFAFAVFRRRKCRFQRRIEGHANTGEIGPCGREVRRYRNIIGSIEGVSLIHGNRLAIYLPTVEATAFSRSGRQRDRGACGNFSDIAGHSAVCFIVGHRCNRHIAAHDLQIPQGHIGI